MASGATWSKDEILKLIDVWGQENIQTQLEDSKRNQTVYEKIAKELQEAGYNRTYSQCRDKIKKTEENIEKLKIRRRRQGKGISSGIIWTH